MVGSGHFGREPMGHVQSLRSKDEWIEHFVVNTGRVLKGVCNERNDAKR